MLKKSRGFFSRLISKNFLLESCSVVVVALSASIIGLWIFREGPRAIFKHGILLAGDGSLEGVYIKTANQVPLLKALLHPVAANASLGWPGQLNFSGYPIGQTTDLIFFRIVRRIAGVGDVGTLIHIMSILKVVPIALAVLLFARLLKIPRILAIVIAIGYSISTFNLVRSEGHVFLSFSWSIPLGLAAIYLAFKASMPGTDGVFVRRGWKHFVGISLLLVLVSFSGFYYTLFMGMLTFALVVPIALSETLKQWSSRSSHSVMQGFGRLLRRISSFVYVLAFLLLGLLYQTVPILIEASKNPTLTGIADRSPIEAVVYAGTLDSFFYDSSSLFLRLIKRQDLLNFLSSRISWEGSQLGATAGIAAYLAIAFLVFSMIRHFFFGKDAKQVAKTNLLEDPRFRFVIYLLAVAFALYISSPFNFAVSRVLPEIRSWGRMSVILTLLILSLLALLISKIWNRRLVAGILTAALFVIPMTEAYFFHRDRPASVALSDAAISTQALRAATLGEMKSLYAQGCPIFIAPVYPFPEFDRPDDANIDYAELDLPLQDAGYFKWSYPAVKDTTNWSAFQPLVSEQPPFPRASLSYQFAYAQALGACGAVIDRTLLTPDELTQLGQIASDSKGCFVELPGETFQAGQRFASLNFKSKGCDIAVNPSISSFAKANLSADFLWRIDQPNGLKYIDKWQVFSNASPIDFRLIKSNSLGAKAPIYSFKFTPANVAGLLTAVKVCLRRTSDVVPVCANVELNRNGEGSLVGEPSQLKTNLQKYEFTVAPESAALIANWGVVVGV